jgi:hypothetical protein
LSAGAAQQVAIAADIRHLMNKPGFSGRELAQVGAALDELALRRQADRPVELRRDGVFGFEGQEYPAVMGIYLPGTRTAVLYDATFAGPAVGQPLGPPESIRAVLAASLLTPALRRRWLGDIRAAETTPPAAVILEAGAIRQLLLEADGGKGLPLQRLGAEAAFALGHCFAATRPAWLKVYRPEVVAFFQSLLPAGWPLTRLSAPTFDPWAAPIRC